MVNICKYIEDYIRYYSIQDGHEKFVGFVFLPLYFLFSIFEATGLLIGGAIVLSHNSGAWGDCSNVFGWCLGCIIICAGTFIALICSYENMDQPVGGSCNTAKFVETVFHVFSTFAKFSMFIYGAILYANISDPCKDFYINNYDSLWILFQVIFWYYTAFVILFVPFIIYYTLVILFCRW